MINRKHRYPQKRKREKKREKRKKFHGTIDNNRFMVTHGIRLTQVYTERKITENRSNSGMSNKE